MKVLTVHLALALESRLKHLFNTDKLFDPVQRKEHTDDGFTVKVLTSDGKALVQEAVKYCLRRGVTPDCSVGGDNGRCDGDVQGLNMLEYQDLLEKLEYIARRP